MAASDIYPLYLHDIADAEWRLLIEIMTAAKRARLFQQRKLERLAGHSLRYVLGSLEEADASTVEIQPPARASISQAKLVWLYDYVMTDLRKLCEKAARRPSEDQKTATALLRQIDRLNEMGLRSGRYDRDMHLFNLEHMYLDTRSATINERFESDAYIGFRYDSLGEQIIVSVLRLHEARPVSRGRARGEGRHVFQAAVIGEDVSRLTRGLAYQLGQQLNLFGFLNDDHGGEFFALRSGDTEHRTLLGVVNTVDRFGVPHAKQCVFFKMGTLFGLDDVEADDLFVKRHALSMIADRRDQFFYGMPGKWLVSRRSGDLVNLDDYIGPTLIKQPSSPTRRAGSNPDGAVY